MSPAASTAPETPVRRRRTRPAVTRRAGLQLLLGVLVVGAIPIVSTARILQANALRNEQAHTDEALRGMGLLLAATRHVCISCHDFLSDDLRTKAFVKTFLVAHGFDVTTRPDAPEPWTRDYVYGTRRRAT